MACSRCGVGAKKVDTQPTIRPGTNQVPRAVRAQAEPRPISEAVRNAVAGLRYVPK